jgi:hypothetical protein
MDRHEFTASRHALSRALDMALDADEIALCLESPQRILRSGVKEDCIVYIRDRLAIPVNEETNVIVTFLWNRYDPATGKYEPRFERGDDMGFIRDNEESP